MTLLELQNRVKAIQRLKEQYRNTDNDIKYRIAEESLSYWERELTTELNRQARKEFEKELELEMKGGDNE